MDIPVRRRALEFQDGQECPSYALTLPGRLVSEKTFAILFLQFARIPYNAKGGPMPTNETLNSKEKRKTRKHEGAKARNKTLIFFGLS